MLLVQGRISQKYGFHLAVLGSQVIVVKCTAAIFFPTVDWYLLGVKMNSSHTNKTKIWYLLGVIFKISDDHPRHFHMGAFHPQGGAWAHFPKQRLVERSRAR